MQYLEIILNLPVNQGFTYSYIPPENEKPELVPEIGKRAEIMFGNKKTQGFIIGIFEDLPFRNAPDFPDIRLNSCNEIGLEKDGRIHYYIIYRAKVQ